MTIKELRLAKGVSQEQLASILDCTQETISRIENGERRPSPELAQRIATYFGLSIYEIWRLFYETKEE